MKLKDKISDSDMTRIKDAVKQAEQNISGEIVPVIVERSGIYEAATYRAAVIFSSITFLSIIIFDRYVPQLAVYDPLMIMVFVMLAGVVGAILANSIDEFKRLFIRQSYMDFITRLRAENAFLEEEIFNTRHRTGIMIFISFFEHEVIVMADRGISKVVDQKYWDKMVADLIANIRKDRVVEGLEQAIHQCGNVLLEKGFKKNDDDVNELRDDLRIN